MNAKITGEIVIFKNRKGLGYYTTTSQKKEDGTYDNKYISVGFRKGVEFEECTKIKVNDGFLTHYSYKDENGETKKNFKIMVLDFEIIEVYPSKKKNNSQTTTETNTNTTETNFEDIFTIESEKDLPF